ncbi:C-C chemokine receptor type 10 [Boleophthalmus pectinirostris]|uniref:C-C chemokine receptor type 10 n=1 Tax=Boleophthalmus pectinirostris TaxID=150288 RepID=UPI0024301953|nr:C-C chemokine receptor type 10 [Boleophthalmus pectinirostris]
MATLSTTTTMDDFGDNYTDYEDYNDSTTSMYPDLNSFDYCEAGDHELTIKVFQSCFFCLIFFTGIIGNCLVIATFSLYRRFRLRSMTDVFLFHLALADLLLLLTLPLQATDTHLGWIFSSPLCKLTRACYAINTYSGLMLLACISVDRYMVVAKAQEMLRLRRQILTGGKVAAVCVWLVAVLLSLPEILYSGVSTLGDEHYCGMKISGTVKKATNGAIIAIFGVSFLVMVTCYSSIAKVLSEGHKFNQSKQWPRQRTLKLMVSLVVVFVLFQLPYTVVLLHKMAASFCGLLLEYITCTLAYMRCCLNPILYALVGVRFRNDVVKLIRDSGCPCGAQATLHTVSSTSMSPPLAISSPCSPTSPERSTNSTTDSTKFKFPNSSVSKW